MRSPKELGAEAFREGKTVKDNPFEADTLAAHNWEQSFKSEAEEDWDELSWYFESDYGKKIRNIDFYIEKAKWNLGTESDRELSLKLGLAPNAVHGWWERKAFPAEKSIIKLAEIAGEPAQKAILELNIWRSKDDTRALYEDLYQKLRKRLSNAALVLVIACLSVLFLSTPAHAEQFGHKTPLNYRNYTLSHI